MLFHLHIPKTAGSLFNSILKKNYGKRFLHENPYLSTQKYTSEDIKQMIDFYTFDCYAGHVFSIPEIPLLEYENMKLISFVRDPVEKYFSYYFFQRSRNNSSSESKAKRLDLEDYIKWHKNNINKKDLLFQDSSQLQWVYCKNKIDDELRSLIRQGKYLIFPSERFDEACVLLEKIFPDILPDCSYSAKTNVSKRDQKVTPELIERVKMFPWIVQDKEFHTLANNNIDLLIRTNFKSEKDFESKIGQFRNRCKAKSKNSPISLMKKVLRG